MNGIPKHPSARQRLEARAAQGSEPQTTLRPGAPGACVVSGCRTSQEAEKPRRLKPAARGGAAGHHSTKPYGSNYAMNVRTIVRTIALTLLVVVAPTAASPFRVAVTATGNGSGDSWVNATDFATLHDTGLSPTPTSGQEVWVQQGTYDGPITLIDGVKYYGGFLGTETAASQSDPDDNETVIDGGLAGPAVVSDGDSATTILRGFRITNGYDTSSLTVLGGGGGAALTNSSVMIVQCVFDTNTADIWGGAVLVDGGSPEFISCDFHDNGNVQVGVDEEGDPIHSTPIAGGAVYVRKGSPTFTNCLFYNNTGQEAGAIANDDGRPTLINCTIADNTATIGTAGGLHDSGGVTTVKNSVFWGNTAVRGGDQIFNYSRRSTRATNTNVQGGFAGTGNIDADPLFEVAAGDYRLQSTSPCRDIGVDASLPPDVADLDWDGDKTESVPLDLDMLARITYANVDIGAYEYRECATDADCTGGDVCCTELCQPCCDNADCADGLFCNGVETCSGNSCLAGSDPCDPGQTCNEALDMCGCLTDLGCSDGVFCNGAELCVNDSCEAGTDPCPGQFCDEVAQDCVWCNQDSDCQAGEMCCSGNCQECCNNSDCPGFLNLCCPSQGFVCSTTCPQ